MTARIFIVLLQAYRVLAAPVKIMLGMNGCCRFTPSCSHYMEEAIRRHGAVSGLRLGLLRVLRCHPWGTAGHDPVPDLISRCSCGSGLPQKGFYHG
jgi:putative membrane protein insertion efficiency factor